VAKHEKKWKHKMKIESHPLFSPLVLSFQFWHPVFETVWKSEKRGRNLKRRPDSMLERGGLYRNVSCIQYFPIRKFANVYYRYVVYWIMPHIHSAANLQSRIQLVTTTWKSLYHFELWNSGMKRKNSVIQPIWESKASNSKLLGGPPKVLRRHRQLYTTSYHCQIVLMAGAS
jgi:hypothetical protein